MSERERLEELEREARSLKRANEILSKASAYFAQAELDRPPVECEPMYHHQLEESFEAA